MADIAAAGFDPTDGGLNVHLKNSSGGGGGPVTAVSGAFVSNAIVDLFTLLTLAGAPGDVNTANSLMGRLTKIRDLLNGTLTVGGTITEANSAAILADLATLAGIVSGAKAAVKAGAGDVTDLATLAGIVSSSKAAVKAAAGDFADLATIAGAITAAIMQINLNKVGGNAIAVGNNAVPTLNSAAAGFVAAYGSNAAALTANTDYAFKWGASGLTQVNHVKIFNGTTINILYEESDTATNAGSPYLAPGQTLYFDVQTAAVHLQGNGTPNVNGASAGNIVVRGWL